MRSKGFTLLEVMVALGVVSVLGLMLVQVFNNSQTAFDHGSANLELMRRSRVVTDRMLPYISSASDFAGNDGLPFPQVGTPPLDVADPTTWPQHLIFRTTENFLDPTYDPEVMISYPDVLAENYQTYLFAVWIEGDGSDGRPDNIASAELTDAVCLAPLSDPPSEDLAFYQNPWPQLPSLPLANEGSDYIVLGRDIQDLRFRRLTVNAVNARVTVVENARAANRQERPLTYNHEAIIQLPSFLYD